MDFDIRYIPYFQFQVNQGVPKDFFSGWTESLDFPFPSSRGNQKEYSIHTILYLPLMNFQVTNIICFVAILFGVLALGILAINKCRKVSLTALIQVNTNRLQMVTLGEVESLGFQS